MPETGSVSHRILLAAMGAQAASPGPDRSIYRPAQDQTPGPGRSTGRRSMRPQPGGGAGEKPLSLSTGSEGTSCGTGARTAGRISGHTGGRGPYRPDQIKRPPGGSARNGRPSGASGPRPPERACAMPSYPALPIVAGKRSRACPWPCTGRGLIRPGRTGPQDRQA